MTSLALSKVQAGFPSPCDDFLEPALSLDEYLIDNPPATFLVKIIGNSMLNAGICEGDIAVVDRSKRPKHHDIVVAVKNNEFLIKELLVEKNCLRLRAHNK